MQRVSNTTALHNVGAVALTLQSIALIYLAHSLWPSKAYLSDRSGLSPSVTPVATLPRVYGNPWRTGVTIRAINGGRYPLLPYRATNWLFDVSRCSVQCIYYLRLWHMYLYHTCAPIDDGYYYYVAECNSPRSAIVLPVYLEYFNIFYLRTPQYLLWRALVTPLLPLTHHTLHRTTILFFNADTL